MGDWSIPFPEGWESMKSWQKAIILAAAIISIFGGLFALLNAAHDTYQWVGGDQAQNAAIQNITPPRVIVNLEINGSIISQKSSGIAFGGLSNESLKKQAIGLANNISSFIGDNDIQERRQFPYFDENTNNPNGNYSVWAERTNRRETFEEAAVKDFNVRYFGEVIGLMYEFQKRNITDGALDAYCWHQDYFSMHEIPVSLHQMANKLS